MTLARREKQILLEACELIATTKDNYYSCWAIAERYRPGLSFESCVTVEKYRNFYKQDYYLWDLPYGIEDGEYLSSMRQTLLLFFREAANDVD